MPAQPRHTSATSRDESTPAELSLQVTSETGRLRQVIVHTPGPEMEMVSPDALKDLLFEDILFPGKARSEHADMCSVFRKIVGRHDAVLQISDLLLEAFSQEEARTDFVDQLCRVFVESNFQAFQEDLQTLSPEELRHFAVTGVSSLRLSSRPLPNLMFTRDVAAVVNDHVVLSHPATAARARESIITDIVLRYHPALSPCLELEPEPIKHPAVQSRFHRFSGRAFVN